MTTRPTPPAPPEFGDLLQPHRESAAFLEFLALRRSTKIAQFTEPGPSPEEVDALLTVAARVPDHGKLAPWRFVVFEGEARELAGRVIEKIARERNPDMKPEQAETERNRFLRAPVVVGVVSHAIDNHKIPVWEQILSAGAACQTLLLAAQAMGYAGAWITEWCAYDNQLAGAFGLGPGERFAGFIFLGSAAGETRERDRPRPPDLIARWPPQK